MEEIGKVIQLVRTAVEQMWVVPQIMEEDVPVICNDTYSWLSRLFSSRTRMLTCPCCARQVLMAVQTEHFWTSVDVPVVAHDREMPQIRFFVRV